MAKRKRLTKRQLAVIDDLFAGDFSEQQVLDKHKVSKNLYNKWLSDGTFADDFDRRIDWLNRQSQALIARYAPLAAAKLVQLTESQSQETARKACLDIISLPKLSEKTERPTGQQSSPDRQQPYPLTPETASRLLAALAQAERKGQ